MNPVAEKNPHRRFNPLKREWVLVSPNRTQRPWQGQMEKPVVPVALEYDPDCYLCPGNVRAGGARTDKYASTYVFEKDYAGLKLDAPRFFEDEGGADVAVVDGIAVGVAGAPLGDEEREVGEGAVLDVVAGLGEFGEEHVRRGDEGGFALARCVDMPEAFVAPNDPAGLARRLIELASDRRRLDELGQVTREQAAGRTWTDVARRHVDLYEEVIDARRPAGRRFWPRKSRG